MSSVAGCDYIAGSFSVPGKGTLSIDSLGPNQTAQKTKDSGKPVLLKGMLFIAKMQVQQPATDPSSGLTDLTPSYPGNGTFEAANTQWKGT